jgi:hypothetical protein
LMGGAGVKAPHVSLVIAGPVAEEGMCLKRTTARVRRMSSPSSTSTSRELGQWAALLQRACLTQSPSLHRPQRLHHALQRHLPSQGAKRLKLVHGHLCGPVTLTTSKDDATSYNWSTTTPATCG